MPIKTAIRNYFSRQQKQCVCDECMGQIIVVSRTMAEEAACALVVDGVLRRHTGKCDLCHSFGMVTEQP